jgi:hypothetical protein
MSGEGAKGLPIPRRLALWVASGWRQARLRPQGNDDRLTCVKAG